MALIPVEGDPWLTEAEACERLCTEIHGQISERNKEFVTSDRYQHISAGITVRLNQFNGQVKELRRKLNEINSQLTSEEAERRLREVEILESKRIRLQSEFINIGREKLEREKLLAPGTSVWQDDDDDDALLATDREALLKNYSTQQIREQNQKVLEEQDEGLENLSKIISRQKDVAIKIHSEIENQSELVDGIGNDMESVDVRLSTETRHITEVVRQPSLCGYYLFILLLLVILILVVWLK